MANAPEPIGPLAAGERDRAIPPSISAHRLVSNGRSSALVRPDGEIDWWCAPRYDSDPLLWSLLDPAGAAARWLDVRFVELVGTVAGAVVRSTMRALAGTVQIADGIVALDGGAVALVRAVRSVDGHEIAMAHTVSLGGFGGPALEWLGSEGLVGGLEVAVVGGSSSVTTDRTQLRTLATVNDGWAGLAVVVGSSDRPPFRDLLCGLETLDSTRRRRAQDARLPRRHPDRAADALAVLDACTFEATGAVVASPTTSLPEVPGGDRQFDYRYCWLRDAGLACSVAALLGNRGSAQRYLHFVNRVAAGAVPDSPLVTITGDSVPAEREVDGIAGWAGSRPVRVGNAASGQLQYDALGLVSEAVSVYLQTGGTLDGDTWQTVRGIADAAATAPREPTSGIWEFREERDLVSADLGRWLALDRAIWICRGWRPLARRRHWKKARREVRDRVLDALGPDGLLPQTYGGHDADASALMAPLFGMLNRKDPRADQLVDRTLSSLGAGPYLYRYEPGEGDGFSGREGAFVPMSWWAVSALAAVGRVADAERRLDELCRRLPRLLAEEVDPASDQSLGNVPLVWSHMELARALYVVDAARLRERWGVAGLWFWRLGRYVRLRWFTSGEPTR